VSANTDIGKMEDGGQADTRSAGKADENRVMMFQKVRPYQQSTKEIVQYQRAVPLGQLLYRSTETKD